MMQKNKPEQILPIVLLCTILVQMACTPSPEIDEPVEITSTSVTEPVFTESTENIDPTPTIQPRVTDSASISTFPLLETHFDSFGFSILIPEGWIPNEGADSITFTHPDNEHIWVNISSQKTNYYQSVADENLIDEAITEIYTEGTDTYFVAHYQCSLGPILYGRCTDYITNREADSISGAITFGTTIRNIAWSIQWETPTAIYPEYIEMFLSQLASFQLK